MKTWRRPLLWWIYSAVAVTGVCALVHVAVQQDLRQGTNDPQIQLAEDAAATLATGQAAGAVASTNNPVDIAHSLAPWVAVYDQNGTLINATGLLNGKPPQLPSGVFDVSNWKSIVGHHLTTFYPANEDRITWQFTPTEASGPQFYNRQAVVIVQYNAADGGGFVASGRSLREVESRESQLTLEVFTLWAFTLLCLLVGSFILDRIL
jgi:hypothetical protein